MENERDHYGRFAIKGNQYRKVRSIRLTNFAWDALEDRASEQDMTKADYIEALVNGDVQWEAEDDKPEPELDFDLDEVIEILTEALTLKSNAGGKIKTEIRKALELMGVELESD